MLRKISLIMVIIGVALCAIAGISVYNSPAIESLQLNHESKTLTINTYFDLDISVNPSKAKFSKYGVDWESSNPQVATVTTSGRVKAVQVGTATITAKYRTHKLECKITVEPVFVTDIALAYDYLAVHPEETMQITATVNPSNATYTDVTWNSSNPQVATVDQTGLVTGVSVGETTITVSGA